MLFVAYQTILFGIKVVFTLFAWGVRRNIIVTVTFASECHVREKQAVPVIRALVAAV